ncbi:hypothetical protein BC628DRAFT_662255 [Trametes gibbosa]|nr:hypothetical protein BC628DRAFT_662255 [Trametes gibbosa]
MPPSRTQPQAPSGSGSNNIFRRFTNKLRSSSTHPSSARSASTPAKSPPTAPVPERKRTGLRMPIALPAMPKAPVPAPPPNDFTSREQRQAALRARGLLPNVPSPYRDANGFMVSLSQQEAELDRRYTVVVDDKESSEAESEAKKIREAWLARNRDAEGASVRGSLDIAGSVGEDAARCAGRDGMLGDRSPVRATFVDASSPTEIASPLEVTVEDFHTAPSSPSAAPPSLSVSTDPPAALTDTPRSSLTTDDAQTPLAASPAGTVRAKPRKEKPPPIIVTTQRPSSSFDSKRVPAPQVVAFTGAAPSDSEASITSDARSSLETRGRPAISAAAAQRQSRDQPPLLGHSVSSGSSNGTGSRANTLPALSPTRTVSSSGAESALPTPTTTSCQRDVSISRGSTSHSSDQSHGIAPARGRRGDDSFAKGKVGAPLIQSSIEETDPSEEDDGEFGVAPVVNVVPPTARPRPPRLQTAEQAVEGQLNRKSFSLFGKKSLDSSRPPAARSSSSMSNLRRAFTGGFAAKHQQRPRSSLEPIPQHAQPVLQPKRSRLFDASHLPASPTLAHPPSGPGGGVLVTSAVPLQGRTTGVGLRPRQAVAPTMHSRGTILHQAHFIEDDESRRLSEMAFLL